MLQREQRKGTLLHCWQECKLIQSLCKAVWRLLKKLKMELPYDPAISLLGTYSEKVKSESLSVVSDSLQPHRLQPARLLCQWNPPGKNTGVGSHSLLQEIFPTQELNPGLLHCGWILYHLSHQGNPKQKSGRINPGWQDQKLFLLSLFVYLHFPKYIQVTCYKYF